jgi:hypothetical protein
MSTAMSSIGIGIRTGSYFWLFRSILTFQTATFDTLPSLTRRFDNILLELDLRLNTHGRQFADFGQEKAASGFPFSESAGFVRSMEASSGRRIRSQKTGIPITHSNYPFARLID